MNMLKKKLVVSNPSAYHHLHDLLGIYPPQQLSAIPSDVSGVQPGQDTRYGNRGHNVENRAGYQELLSDQAHSQYSFHLPLIFDRDGRLGVYSF